MASGERPPRADVLRAIDAYLANAYDAGAPRPVAERVERLAAWPEGDFYGCPLFEREPGEDPQRYAFRLGNRHYPHMKLVIERLPTRGAWFFRADTHDGHVCPAPDDPEYGLFRELMERNRAVAAAIEDAWSREGLLTFREFLRRDLERRQAERAAK